MSRPHPLRFPKKTERPQAAPFPFAEQPQGNAPRSREEELERMLQEAQSRAEAVEREAFEKAYQAGREEGLRVGRKQAERELEAVLELRRELEAMLQALREELAEAAWTFVQMVAAHYLRLALARDEAWIEAVRSELAALPEGPVRVYVHPDRQQKLAEVLTEADVSVEGDAALRPEEVRLVVGDRQSVLSVGEMVREAAERIRAGG